MSNERYKPQNLHDALVRLAEECNEVAKECMKGLRFGLHDYDPKDPTCTANLDRIKQEVDDINEALNTVCKFDMIENTTYRPELPDHLQNLSMEVRGRDYTVDPFMISLRDFLKGKYVSRPRLHEMFKAMGIFVGQDCIEWLMS